MFKPIDAYYFKQKRPQCFLFKMKTDQKYLVTKVKAIIKHSTTHLKIVLKQEMMEQQKNL